ncbi:MAG: TM2 domain-containing protein [Candidatus Omnitrophica bacterium]|nr:TM2 domain-containing protein [Candidatus Omnitrophota bacterium]
MSAERKNFLTALLLSIFVGSLGIDRFYLGYIGLGILKLLTLGGCGVWWLIDLILIASRNLKDANGNPLEGN